MSCIGCETIGNCSKGDLLLLIDGVGFCPEDEWREWLFERKQVGVSTIGVSLSGSREIHDRLVGRRGEYDFLLKAMRLPLN